MEFRKESFFAGETVREKRLSGCSADLPAFSYIGQTHKADSDPISEVLRYYDLNPDTYQNLRRISKSRSSDNCVIANNSQGI